MPAPRAMFMIGSSKRSDLSVEGQQDFVNRLQAGSARS